MTDTLVGISEIPKFVIEPTLVIKLISSQERDEHPLMKNKSLKILVADDQRSMRDLFTHILRMMGYSCDTAVDGRECLLKFTLRSYDVLFLDLVMPEIDGETVLAWIKNQAPDTQVIISSIQDDEGAIKHMLRNGASAYLVKPFTTREVQQIIHTLENRRTAAGLELVSTYA